MATEQRHIRAFVRQRTRRTRILISLFVLVMSSRFATAQTVVIPNTDRGHYSETGFHNPTNPNYVVGDSGGFDFGDRDDRNFFVFDLSSVTQPIASAKLALSVISSV